MGLISGLLESNRHKNSRPVRCFNRRSLSLQIIRILLQHETSRLLAQCGGNHLEAMIQAIEHIRYSGLEYDTQCKTVEAICAKVQAQQVSQPAQLVVVDGLEHFHTEVLEQPHPVDLSKQLRQLKKLAQQNVFPILATSPSVTEATDEDPMVEADYSIHLRNKE